MRRCEVKTALDVRDIATEFDGRAHRVRADVGGEPLWFESPDVVLTPSPEAFGCALLVAALYKGRSLAIETEVSARWLSNVEQLLDVFQAWWGYPCLRPLAAARDAGERPATARTALCFSGGVDSFYSLLRSGRRVDVLLGVHGFDIELRDVARASAFESSLREVAAELGMRAVFVRTNLREHPAFGRAPWERAHGGALAAVGHLLGDSVGSLLISSSHPYTSHTPWGSHWRTDSLWSSDHLEVLHVGAELQRSDKLKAIAREPLVRRHLRVCWENLTPEGNCSRCEKCLRTRLLLADLGELKNMRVFEGEGTLARRLDSLAALRGRGRVFMRLLESGSLSPEVKAALRKLIERSGHANRRPRRLAKKTLGRAIAWAQNRFR
ncbi:MAG TPA: hypothetical protein VF570_05865 [Pyrinomonadaceae bacterium]|jgi:hypothetical protein